MTDQMALSVIEKYGVVDPVQMKEILLANTGGLPVRIRDFGVIHVPVGGSTTFEIPDLSEAGSTPAKYLDGIIVAWNDDRRLYKEAYAPGGDKGPPDCVCPDILAGIGYGDPGGDCATCPFNQWGTARAPDGGQGKGKACREKRHLLLNREGMAVPIMIDVPPTSLKPIRTYFWGLTGQQCPHYGVVTRISLVPGDPSATMKFSLLQKIGRDEVEKMAGYVEAAKQMLKDSAQVRETEEETII